MNQTMCAYTPDGPVDITVSETLYLLSAHRDDEEFAPWEEWALFNARVANSAGIDPQAMTLVIHHDGGHKWFATQEQADIAQEQGIRSDYLVWCLGESMLRLRRLLADEEATREQYIDGLWLACDQMSDAIESHRRSKHMRRT